MQRPDRVTGAFKRDHCLLRRCIERDNPAAIRTEWFPLLLTQLRLMVDCYASIWRPLCVTTMNLVFLYFETFLTLKCNTFSKVYCC